MMRFNRLFVWIAVSMLVHLMAFWFLRFDSAPVAVEQEKYEVRIVYVTPAASEPAVAQSKEKKRVKKKEKTQEAISTEEKREEKREVVQHITEPETEKALEPTEELTEQEPEPETEIAGAPPEESPEQEPEQKAPAGPEPGPEPVQEMQEARTEPPVLQEEPGKTQVSALSLVIEELRRKIMEHQIYPAVARKRGYQGIVFVMIELDPAGNLVSIDVSQSSGYRVLDRAAESLVKKVVPYSHGTGRSITIEIPIKYSLLPGGRD